MSINVYGLASLVKVNDSDLSGLLLRTCHHAHVFGRTHSAKSLSVAHSLNCVDKFQVLEVVHIDLVL